jgi:hypothetical protein
MHGASHSTTKTLISLSAMKKTILTLAIAAALCTAAQATTPQIAITEWMYNGDGPGSIGEFVELTNMGTTAVNMTGWSFDDNTRMPGSQSLSAFGIVNPGQSVILTDDTAADFRTNWGLAATVEVIGGNTNNLGRSDEINIYNASGTLEDRLTYNDQGSGTVAGPRTNGTSAWVPLADIGTNDAQDWVLSSTTDDSGAHVSLAGEIGSPGYYEFAPAPEPSTYVLFSVGLAVAIFLRRRSRKA